MSGRHPHLSRQRRTLAASRARIDQHVVVSLADPGVADLLAQESADAPVTLVGLDADPDRLPLAAGRNAGAAAALEAGAQLLVFLDVDCLAGPELLGRYLAAAAVRPEALLCGPVTYLSQAQSAALGDHQLAEHRAPHVARPNPRAGTLLDGRHELFWSLSFAVTAVAWQQIGGFDEGYTGYGAEDTDFAARAREVGVGLVWVGGADAFHQWHPTASPPVQHVDDIVRNGSRYARRWGVWPMPGWLERFDELGLVEAQGDGWVRAGPLRVASVPPRHPYVDAVRPAAVQAVDVDRVSGWDPDPLLDVEYLHRVVTELDAVHVHFGYEHLHPEALQRSLDLLAAHRVPLVVTVHDLRNPHLADNALHERHLELLMTAAAEVVTLTRGAAAEIEWRYHRTATVIAHPSINTPIPAHGPQTHGRRVVLVPLGALRANTAELHPFLTAAADAVAGVGGLLRVDLRPDALADPRASAARILADEGRLELVVAPRRNDAELAALVAESHAVLLPYRFGTHSGWVETARDLGTHVIVPSCGYYQEQWSATEVFHHDECRGLDPRSLAVACARVLGRPKPTSADPTERRGQRAQIRAAHEIIYRRAVS